MPVSGGPWVQGALLCEKLLEEKDGVLTPVRIIDRVTRFVAGPDAPEEMEPFEYDATLLVILKSGDAVGGATLTVEKESPDGITRPGPSVSVLFEGAERGTNVRMPSHMTFDQVGLYWFNILCDGVLLTRIPLRVIYQRTTSPASRPQF